MSVLTSQLQPGSEEFQHNQAAMQAAVAELRDALARAMEEFLARGGKVQEVEPNVVADPPKKPDSKYAGPAFYIQLNVMA